jgi:two-component system, NarL family, response regulator NreC
MAEAAFSRMKPLKILVADDHEIVRQGLRLLIETIPGWEICGEAQTGPQAVALAAEFQPDVVVMDHGMPDLNGVEATKRIKESAPAAEVIIFSGTDNDSLIHQVFEAGARSYISKAEAGKHLVAAIESVSQHKPYFTDQVSEIIFARYLQPDRFNTPGPEPRSRLTGREREIVQLLAEGKTNKEIADTLAISLRTAETHRSTLMRKLQLRTTADLVRYAIRNHIIQP